MIRKIIKIDEDLCNGCGLCADACHEGAIGMVDGKAKLLRDDYCDGLGNCLPVCPTGAISFEEREAAAFNEAAVKANLENQQPQTLACGCPGTHSHAIARNAPPAADIATAPVLGAKLYSQLNQWPVQIKLVPINAPYFEQANLLIAADCTAYAYANFHNEYMKNRITLIGCPKLDDGDYAEKLTEIIKHNNIKSVTVVRMEVPCCGGLEQAVITALKDSGKMIPWQVVTISTDGRVLES
ncbi:4Fe-4S binding protein [Eubacteriales bacterium OttesenSCG-928-N14]|nr:4Fe-4S binding protein [Eubacteriales bacterium OttesenSCG-928-N14]